MEAKKNRTLKPSIEKALADLIGSEERPKLEVILEDPVVADLHSKLGKLFSAETMAKVKDPLEAPVPAESAEPEGLHPELDVYKQEYDRMSDEAKGRCAWKTVAGRLLANNGEKLKKVQEMQGGGQLVGIDKNGKVLFKDKGVEPVIYGFDKEGRLMKIYDYDTEQVDQVETWADYHEIREQVLKDGYELFADDDNCEFSDEMRQVEAHTNEPFVASKDGGEWRSTWLESGYKPVTARSAFFIPHSDSYMDSVEIDEDRSNDRGENCGAARLLRV